jgi:arylsulfatase A-like enzyme
MKSLAQWLPRWQAARPLAISAPAVLVVPAVLVALLTLAAEAARAADSPVPPAPASTVRPNIVLILADDLGWSDTSLMQPNDLSPTPNLRRLAARGITFTRAYAASPLCSPTRASILTGQTPARNGSTSPVHHTAEMRLEPSVQPQAPPGDKARPVQSVTRLDTRFPTLGRLLRDAGYRTAHFGKWHLGPPPYSPLEHGFEIDLPHTSGPGPAGNFVAPWRFADFQPRSTDEHIEDRMAAEASAWMETVRDEPFYLQYWQFSVHAPFDAKEELIEHYRGRIDRTAARHSPTYAAMVHSLDDAVGTLLDTIDRLAIADRTIIVFTSDNGGNCYSGIPEQAADGSAFVAPPTSNAPLRGGKATVFEGGIRVPQVVVWPGVSPPAGRTDAVTQSTDLYPTLLHAAGVSPPDDYPVDGVDILPAIEGRPFDRGPIFTFFPKAPAVPDWLPPSVAVHRGDWKLIRLFHQGDDGAHAWRLYDLAGDLGEQHDLAGSHPELVAELDAEIQRHLLDARAVVPLPNPRFDPARYEPETIGVQPGGLKVGQTRAERLAEMRPRRKGKAAHGQPAARRPNVLVIFTDDHGWADLGLQRVDEDVRTPHIDALGRDGIRFTRGYVSAPQCVPSRAGLLTGIHQSRFGVEDNRKGPLPHAVVTLPERLRDLGYVTGMSGKWHLDISHERAREGEPRADPDHLPHRHGFDEYWSGSMRTYRASHALDGTPFRDAPRAVTDPRFRITVQTEAALGFLDRRAAEPDRPWFLYVPFFAPHVPLEAAEPWFSSTPAHLPPERRKALAMIAAMDEGVGRLRDKIGELGQERDTLIFCISDNGAPLKENAWDGSLNLPLVGEKGMLTDGGVRVPFVAAWPGTIPSGGEYDHPVTSLDVAATALVLAGGDLEAATRTQADGPAADLGSLPLDGVDLMPFLTGTRSDPPHAAFFWRWRSQAAVLEFPWKLVRLGVEGRYLFDVTEPAGERVNLLAEHPELAARLERSLDEWTATLRPPGQQQLHPQDATFFAEHVDQKPESSRPSRPRPRRAPAGR